MDSSEISLTEAAAALLAVAKLAPQLETLLDQGAQPQDGFLRVPEAAEFLGLTPDALRGLVKRDKVPHQKIGRRIMFDRAELRQWVRSGAAG